jgi:hypothetical protein
MYYSGLYDPMHSRSYVYNNHYPHNYGSSSYYQPGLDHSRQYRYYEPSTDHFAIESSLRRQHYAGDLQQRRIETEAWRRRTDLNRQVESSRGYAQHDLRNSMRRLRIENEVDNLLRRY